METSILIRILAHHSGDLQFSGVRILCRHVFAKNEIIKCEMKRYRKYKQKCVNNVSKGDANWPDRRLDVTLCRAGLCRAGQCWAGVATSKTISH